MYASPLGVPNVHDTLKILWGLEDAEPPPLQEFLDRFYGGGGGGACQFENSSEPAFSRTLKPLVSGIPLDPPLLKSANGRDVTKRPIYRC